MKLTYFATLLLSVSLSGTGAAQTKAELTLDDIMHFQSITEQALDPQGQYLAYSTAPDRGDATGYVKALAANTTISVAGANEPLLSHDGRFTAFWVKPALLAVESASAKERKKLKPGVKLVDNRSGAIREFTRVKSVNFSEDGRFLVLWHEPEENAKEERAKDELAKKAEAPTEGAAAVAEKTTKTAKEDMGSTLELLDLHQGTQVTLDHITAWQLAYNSHLLLLAQNDSATQLHQLLALTLDGLQSQALFSSKEVQIGAVAVSRDASTLAYTTGPAATVAAERPYQLSVLHKGQSTPQQVTAINGNGDGWLINRYSKLNFSADGERLFFGRVPQIAKVVHAAKVKQTADLYDQSLITSQRGLHVWHGDDPLIKPNEIKQYEKEQQRGYLAVLHLQSGSIVQLGDSKVPDVQLSEHRRFLLASSDIPYRKMITWAGFFRDYYLVDVNTGHKQLLVAQQSTESEPSFAPAGKYLAWYQQGQVFLYDVASGRKTLLSGAIKTPFANEDHDYPSAPPGYGFGPWLVDDSALLVYDKYDIWQFDTASHRGFMLTAGEGRKQGVSFRVEGLAQPDKAFPATVNAGESLLLQGYSERTKADSFYQSVVGKAGVRPLLEEPAKLEVLARADKANTVLFSKQRYDLYPDLYSAPIDQPAQAQQQTQLDLQRQQLPWGTSELVHWRDGDGRVMDGALIKPAHYQPGKRYPVMVYYYRFMSDRLFAFPDMKINHRPNFPWYAADDYVIFLPDIRFEIGYPGSSSVKALTAGVQKLIDMGIADPAAIGLQGHSWSGYQTAFDITQTNMFRAAVAGAPVANMTSAYSGIRLGTGLSRQFQYETGQSRIGESLMQAPQKYIENSPVFYVERIQTPLLIMFGDKDDAVPWEQGIELYMAMRRAGKEVIMLQYEDEPHHLKKYPNKLDYTIRMKQFFDHYLKGKAAPTWMTSGEPYQPVGDED